MRELRVERDGARLFALEDGVGPTVIMLHGGIADHRAALPFVAPLAAHHRVVTPDLRACGRSWWSGPLTFELLADDVAALLDHIGEARAVIGGVSSGAGVALRFAVRHAARTLGLVLLRPIHAGATVGYTAEQRRSFAAMDAAASRAIADGVQVLRPMYVNLPQPMRARALAMLDSLDPGSVVTTSRFLAAGSQPFESAEDLSRLSMPVLLLPGNDSMHPAAVSALYAANIPGCTILDPATPDVPSAIETFVARAGSD